MLTYGVSASCIGLQSGYCVLTDERRGFLEEVIFSTKTMGRTSKLLKTTSEGDF